MGRGRIPSSLSSCTCCLYNSRRRALYSGRAESWRFCSRYLSRFLAFHRSTAALRLTTWMGGPSTVQRELCHLSFMIAEKIPFLRPVSLYCSFERLFAKSNSLPPPSLRVWFLYYYTTILLYYYLHIIYIVYIYIYMYIYITF